MFRGSVFLNSTPKKRWVDGSCLHVLPAWLLCHVCIKQDAGLVVSPHTLNVIQQRCSYGWEPFSWMEQAYLSRGGKGWLCDKDKCPFGPDCKNAPQLLSALSGRLLRGLLVILSFLVSKCVEVALEPAQPPTPSPHCLFFIISFYWQPNAQN